MVQHMGSGIWLAVLLTAVQFQAHYSSLELYCPPLWNVIIICLFHIIVIRYLLVLPRIIHPIIGIPAFPFSLCVHKQYVILSGQLWNFIFLEGVCDWFKDIDILQSKQKRDIFFSTRLEPKRRSSEASRIPLAGKNMRTKMEESKAHG